MRTFATLETKLSQSEQRDWDESTMKTVLTVLVGSSINGGDCRCMVAIAGTGN